MMKLRMNWMMQVSVKSWFKYISFITRHDERIGQSKKLCLTLSISVKSSLQIHLVFIMEIVVIVMEIVVIVVKVISNMMILNSVTYIPSLCDAIVLFYL